ncbi:MAG: hypothetical protein AB7C95_00675 [Synergistaceae bacterium]
MLKALKFVQGAVAKKDFQPALTHFLIKDGTIRGYNGKITICSPIDIDLEAKPRADKMVKAIQACSDTVSLHITPAGKLAIKSGTFKAYIDCTEDEFPFCDPVGERVELPDAHFVSAIKELQPFIAEDASRPWALGILLNGQSAFATNNVVLVQKWMKTWFPYVVNIPKEAVTEIVRIGMEPTHMQLDGKHMTLFYPDDSWIRFLLNATEWPDLTQILDRESNAEPIPEGLWAAARKLMPFADPDTLAVYGNQNSMVTSKTEGRGAAVEVKDLNIQGGFCLKYLVQLEGVATKMDFSNPPGPHAFFGDNLRGVIMGLNIHEI